MSVCSWGRETSPKSTSGLLKIKCESSCSVVTHPPCVSTLFQALRSSFYKLLYIMLPSVFFLCIYGCTAATSGWAQQIIFHCSEYQIKQSEQQPQLCFQAGLHEYQIQERIRIQNSCFSFLHNHLTVIKTLSPPNRERNLWDLSTQSLNSCRQSKMMSLHSPLIWFYWVRKSRN